MSTSPSLEHYRRIVDSFLSPELTIRQMDTYIPRKAILDALLQHISDFHGLVLDLGCGNMPYRDLILKRTSAVAAYVGLDVPSAIYERPDVYWDGRSIPFGDGTVGTVFATEVLEHCPHPSTVFAEIARVLQPGGTFFMTVPFLWPLHDIPNDEYRYTPYSLQRLMHDAGLAQIEIRALGGWDASLAQMIGLWVRRRPMAHWKRALASPLALLAMKWLLARDRVPRYAEGAMITGLSAIAYKPKRETGAAPDTWRQGSERDDA